MKLNPFSKKSNPYLDKIKSEHDALNLELMPLKAELAEAEAEHAAAREKQNRLREAAGSLSMNTPPAAKAHWPILCEANQRMERLKSKVSNLESQLRPLQQVLATPERFAVARKQLDDLMAQRKAFTAEVQTVDGQLTKITKRLADLEARIAVETKSASRALLDTEA
jgi:chromosome segregation ATPase